MKKSLLSYFIFIVIVILSLLLAHTFPFMKNYIVVDNTSILLIIILIILPFIPNIKKIKWGDFEAEIDIKEIHKLEKSVKKMKSTDISTKMSLDKSKIKEYDKSKLADIYKRLLFLAESDPTMALVELKIELEKIIRSIYELRYGKKEQNLYFDIYFMTTELVKKDVIQKDILESIKILDKICNRVSHGENIGKDNSKNVIILGFEVLATLYGYALGFSIGSMVREYEASSEEQKSKN